MTCCFLCSAPVEQVGPPELRVWTSVCELLNLNSNGNQSLPSFPAFFHGQSYCVDCVHLLSTTHQLVQIFTQVRESLCVLKEELGDLLVGAYDETQRDPVPTTPDSDPEPDVTDLAESESDIEPETKCQHCEAWFSDPQECKQHEETEHFPRIDVVPFVVIPVPAPPTPAPGTLINVRQNPKNKNPNRPGRRRHNNLKNGIQIRPDIRLPCKTCGLVLSLPKLLVHVQSHLNTAQRVCNLCSNQYFSLEQLRSHIYTHYNVEPFECKLCGRTYALKQSAINHLARTHGKGIGAGRWIKTLIGDEEGESGSKVSSSGSGSAPPPTPTLPISLLEQSRRSTLKKKLKQFKMSKQFMCPLCGMQVCSKYSLQRHISCMHKKYSETLNIETGAEASEQDELNFTNSYPQNEAQVDSNDAGEEDGEIILGLRQAEDEEVEMEPVELDFDVKIGIDQLQQPMDDPLDSMILGLD